MEFQGNSLRQVAALYTRQGLTLHYGADQAALSEEDEETRICAGRAWVEELASSAR